MNEYVNHMSTMSTSYKVNGHAIEGEYRYIGKEIVVDLLLTKEESNKIIALGMVYNMDWNLKSKRHITIMEILWYGYFGSWMDKEEPGHELELKVGKEICKPMNIWFWKSLTSDDSPDYFYSTEKIHSKARTFASKYGYDRNCDDMHHFIKHYF